MLFLGLGTGLGSALITDGVLVPMELAHLLYRKGRTYENYLGLRGLKRYGKKKWRRYIADVVTALRMRCSRLRGLGDGNAKRLKGLPKDVRLGDNEHAFTGGFACGKRRGRMSELPVLCGRAVGSEGHGM
jgi:polyphosphate glucokinase